MSRRPEPAPAFAFVQRSSVLLLTCHARPPTRSPASVACWNGVGCTGAGQVAWLLAIQQTPRQRPSSEEHTSELQSQMRISYAVFCLNKQINTERVTKEQSADDTENKQLE